MLTPHLKYHQSLVYKVFNARKSDATADISFEDTLAIIRRIHACTLGIPQVVYLVGWQYAGHDSKYPSWAEGNTRLKRPADVTALDSIRWLMTEAKKFNAVVSLHINMDDAYENSPLWDEYVANGLIVLGDNGQPVKCAVWDGEVSYNIDKRREWDLGLAKRRIDRLVVDLPLSDAGTVHIDAFRPVGDAPEEVAAFKAIVEYWYSLGVDVTTEYLASRDLIGWLPMIYHYNADEQDRLTYPPWVICGGGTEWNKRTAPLTRDVPWIGMFCVPSSGCRYEEAWGYSIDNDIALQNGAVDWPRYESLIYSRTLPWAYTNQWLPIELVQSADSYQVRFTTDVVCRVSTADRRITLLDGDRWLVDGGDVCIPARWADRPTIIAYSSEGCQRQFYVPNDWSPDGEVSITLLNSPETNTTRGVRVADGRFSLSLGPGQAVAVRPEG